VAHQPHARGRGEGQGETLSRAVATIAAVATPPGRGGIGIVRVSGPQAAAIARKVTGSIPEARVATVAAFRDRDGGVIDRGLAIYFPGPHSYTGEDVLELQGHGGSMVMELLLRRVLEAGAQLAQPGEFTRRAYLNDRIDLAQAESVADLIDASTAEAARSASRSLEGEFSARVEAIANALLDLRMHVEACIDFPEEEIDTADREAIARKTADARMQLDALLAQAAQGALLREGLTVVLFGLPNVGKSSLLNRLAGEELAIVTPIPGTTRDYVRSTISIEGVPIHLVDTAGLRESGDEVERIGVERSRAALRTAGAALLVEDASSDDSAVEAAEVPAGIPLARVRNKIDLVGEVGGSDAETPPVIRVSALTGEGIPALRAWLLAAAGWRPHAEGLFMARARHLEALREARSHVDVADRADAFDLRAEDLRLAHRALGRITGEVSADDLLGEIFSRFCIGK
jgi:tRNA modification GTPase